MSITGYTMIEFRRKDGGSWASAGSIDLYGDVNVFFLLADPWGHPEEGDGNPRPIFPPRGFPKDLSHWALSKVAWIADPLDKEDPTRNSDRQVEPEEAEGWEAPNPDADYYRLDPDEWRCATWLTLDEVKTVCDRYLAEKCNSFGRRSVELEAIKGIMQAYEDSDFYETRLLVWFR